MTTAAHDLIVLVPGFLGFDVLGGVSYFDAGRSVNLAAELRRRGLRARIEVARTVPAGALAVRQAALVAQLCAWDDVHCPKHIHLVGHSAGGVDAELLTRARPLGSETWGAAARVRSRLRTIVTCSSPIAGTWLAASELGALVGALGGDGSLATFGRGADETGTFAVAALLAAATNPAVRALALAGISDPARALPFAASLWRHRELIAELHPEAVGGVYACAGARELDVRRLHVVTVAPPPPSCPPTVYAALHDALVRATPAGAVPTERLQRLESVAARRVVTAGWVPTFDGRANDGVVNAALQFGPGAEVLVVVADHLDVLGDGCVTDTRRAIAGLLESDARFGVREARALCREIADVIACTTDVRPRAERTGRKEIEQST